MTTHTQLTESSLSPPIGKGREGKGKGDRKHASVSNWCEMACMPSGGSTCQ
jgi:hypothetical protein